jgi:cytochrome d ubiquinol oxidase subunit I
MKTRYLQTGNKHYDDLSMFFMKLFAINFALGVATGLTMEFEFGTNWSEYSKFVGDIFGAPLALEGLTAFFLESTFMGIFLFGRNRVSDKVHTFSAWMVAIGGTLSALWILIANSWQQTPAGYKIVETPQGFKAELTNFWEAAINHSTVYRFLHTVDGAFITAGIFVMGVLAFYMIKRRHLEFAKTGFKFVAVFTVIATIAQVILGDLHGYEVAHQQPLKLAMVEGKFETEKCSSLDLFGIIDQQNKQSRMIIRIPCLLSILSYHDPNAEVKGITDLINEYQQKSKEYASLIPALKQKLQEAQTPEEKQKIKDQLAEAKVKAHAYNIKYEDLPSIPLVFTTFHLMVYLGFYFVLLALLAWWFAKRGTIENKKGFLWLIVLSIPLPYLANLLGWISAEVGRQPWIVHGMLLTRDGVSFVPASQVALSIAIFTTIYVAFFIVFLYLMFKTIGKGPNISEGNLEPVPPTNPNPSFAATFSRTKEVK